MKRFHKMLAVLLSVLMVVSILSAGMSVLAVDAAPAPLYTAGELRALSRQNGYGLTQTQIDAVVSGKTRLSSLVAD